AAAALRPPGSQRRGLERTGWAPILEHQRELLVGTRPIFEGHAPLDQRAHHRRVLHRGGPKTRRTRVPEPPGGEVGVFREPSELEGAAGEMEGGSGLGHDYRRAQGATARVLGGSSSSRATSARQRGASFVSTQRTPP